MIQNAWQAKYFLGVITDKQWDQISDSVATVLEKYSKLTKYYICLPIDWTDSRKEIKGKSVKSSWDKWIDHVTKWEQLANEKGMKVQFKYWCKHEISQMLQRDKPEFLGRALYWFNEPVINTEILIKIAEKSRKSLAERFTSEFHMDLPIADKFDCLRLTNNWNKQFEEQFVYISEIKNDCNRISDSRINLFKNKNNFIKLNEDSEKLYCVFSYVLINKEFFENINKLKELCKIIDTELEKCNSYIYELIDRENDNELKKNLRELSHDLDKITFKIRNISKFLYNKAISAGKNKSILLIGMEGIGKSHLLCDISLKRLGEGFSTLLLLGQHYSRGNQLEFICSELGLPGYSYRTVLGA